MARNHSRKATQTIQPAAKRRRNLTPLVVVVLFSGIVGWAFYSRRPASTAIGLPGASSSVAAAAPEPPPENLNFLPTIPNMVPAPGSAPRGMVWITGGEFSMGAQDPPEMNEVGMQATADSRPIHRVYVDGFFMDKTDVTNAQFAEFVKATGYVTIAEKTPTQAEFPGAPRENLVAGGVVFSPPNHEVPLNDHFQWWSYVRGANWRHPTGTNSSIKGKEVYP